jgi:ABC-type multidrug transport system fused ATPase/permease subunit
VVQFLGSIIDIALFEDPQFHDQMSLAREQSWRLEAIAIQMPVIVSEVVTLISLLVLIGSVGWMLPVILIVFSLPQAASHGYFTKKKAELYLRDVSSKRMKDYMAQLLSERETAKEIRLFQLKEHLLVRFYEASVGYFSGRDIIKSCGLTWQKKRRILGVSETLGGGEGRRKDTPCSSLPQTIQKDKRPKSRNRWTSWPGKARAA